MKESKKPEFEIIKDPDYKIIYVSGVFGGLNPAEGQMVFYVDTLEPEIDNTESGKMVGGDRITRRLLIDVRMSPLQFKLISEWMARHVERLNNQSNRI